MSRLSAALDYAAPVIGGVALLWFAATGRADLLRLTKPEGEPT